MNAGPNSIGRPVRPPPTRCSYCHGLRVTAIRDRRLGAIGPRSVCAECYQREVGRPWVPPPVVAPVVEVQPVAAVVEVAPVAAVKRKRIRRRKSAPPKPREILQPIDREMKESRFAVLEEAVLGSASKPECLPVGREYRVQLGCLRSKGWVDDAGQATEAGQLAYQTQVEARAEWARRRSRAVKLGRPPGSGNKRNRGPKIGELRWRLLTAAVTGMRAQWLLLCVGRAAGTQIARMVKAGWITRDGVATTKGRAVYLTEVDRRSKGNQKQAGGER